MNHHGSRDFLTGSLSRSSKDILVKFFVKSYLQFFWGLRFAPFWSWPYPDVSEDSSWEKLAPSIFYSKSTFSTCSLKGWLVWNDDGLLAGTSFWKHTLDERTWEISSAGAQISKRVQCRKFMLNYLSKPLPSFGVDSTISLHFFASSVGTLIKDGCSVACRLFCFFSTFL